MELMKRELERISRFLDEKYAAGIRLLEQLVNVDSPSKDKVLTDRAGQVILRYFDQAGITYRLEENRDYGDFILATIRKGGPGGKILLLGHRDTVFPAGTASVRPFKIEGNRAYGPGVADMKGGLVIAILAAQALKETEIEMGDIELLITADEEIGSPSSRPVIERRAREATAVFNLESGRPDGSVVTARRGSAHLTMQIEGVAAHSGLNIEEGISAIEELSHKIIALHRLTDLEQGITVNVGWIEGGVNTNVVAPHATGEIHLGFWTHNDFNQVYTKIKSIIERSYLPGTTSRLEGGISFLPMEKHEGVKKLYRIVQEAASILGIELSEQRTKGAADAGFPASLGVPTICGMGPVGGHYHSEKEYIELDTMIPRAKLLACSMVLASRRLSPS